MGAVFRTTGGGRRLGEKIGRSRVAGNDASDIDHSGLPGFAFVGGTG